MCIDMIKTYTCGFETRRHRKTGSECHRVPLPASHPRTARCVEVYSVCGRCYAELLHGRAGETCRGLFAMGDRSAGGGGKKGAK